MKHYIKLMRIQHYIKNLLVFTALIYSGKLFDINKLLHGCLAAIFFCFISSAVYIINDICDAEKDKYHPTKCHRPIAAGVVPVKKAWILASILLILVLVGNYMIFGINTTLLLLLYFGLNLGYSFEFKRIPIVDVTVLVLGFLIRIIYGAIITDSIISSWLYLSVMAVAFCIAFGKRRNELKQMGNNVTREVLKSYSIGFLDKSMYMCLTLGNVFYALWVMDQRTVALYGNKWLVFTVPVVLLISMKYSLKVEGDSDGEPVGLIIHDKVLIGLSVLYFMIMFGALYL